ncbi:MAG: homoserine dehydrogenase [Vicinamibacteria bacterium]
MTACALVGCGTVGSAVVRRFLEGTFPEDARLVRVAVRDVARPRSVDLGGLGVTADALAAACADDVSIVIEATGDRALGRRLALAAIERGKHFVTAGKDLVASHGLELEDAAATRGVAFRYEAAVAAAVPVIALLRRTLAPRDVRAVEGVLNGTCNFVLGELARGRAFADALAEARACGFAEADSSRDPSGRDTADKVAILARLLGVHVAPGDIPTYGIDALDPADIAYGRRRGLALRLRGFLRIGEAAVAAGVGPAFVPEASLLARARGAENAIVFEGHAAGPVGLIGPGAGGAPTAAALLADVREIAREGAGRPLDRPRAVAVTADAEPRRHYVRADGALDGGALLRRLHERGLAPEALTSERPGRFQLLTRPCATDVLRGAFTGLATAVAVVPIVDEAAADASGRGEPAA